MDVIERGGIPCTAHPERGSIAFTAMCRDCYRQWQRDGAELERLRHDHSGAVAARDNAEAIVTALCEATGEPVPEDALAVVRSLPTSRAACECAEERDQLARQLAKAVTALERIRDHGQTHDEPCWALHKGACAEKMQEIARATLAAIRGGK